MKINSHFISLLLLAIMPTWPAWSQEKKETPATEQVKSIYDFKVKDIDGKDVSLDRYRGQVLLLVNVASRCGLTDRNYAQLEPLYQKYKDKGFRILAFPCNDFGAQEPGTADEIKAFCRDKHRSTYDLFSKVSVKGDEADPLYKYLTSHPNQDVAGEVRWNFQKYLVGRNGEILVKFDPRTDPSDAKLAEAVEKALAEPAPPRTPATDGTDSKGSAGS